MRRKQSLGDCRDADRVQPADVLAFTPELTFFIRGEDSLDIEVHA